jgi:hypothetical protein
MKMTADLPIIFLQHTVQLRPAALLLELGDQIIQLPHPCLFQPFVSNSSAFNRYSLTSSATKTKQAQKQIGDMRTYRH